MKSAFAEISNYSLNIGKVNNGGKSQIMIMKKVF